MTEEQSSKTDESSGAELIRYYWKNSFKPIIVFKRGHKYIHFVVNSSRGIHVVKVDESEDEYMDKMSGDPRAAARRMLDNGLHTSITQAAQQALEGIINGNEVENPEAPD